MILRTQEEVEAFLAGRFAAGRAAVAKMQRDLEIEENIARMMYKIGYDTEKKIPWSQSQDTINAQT